MLTVCQPHIALICIILYFEGMLSQSLFCCCDEALYAQQLLQLCLQFQRFRSLSAWWQSDRCDRKVAEFYIQILRQLGVREGCKGGKEEYIEEIEGKRERKRETDRQRQRLTRLGLSFCAFKAQPPVIYFLQQGQTYSSKTTPPDLSK